MIRWVLLGALVASAACTQPRSQHCREICKREADCIDQTGNKIPFDEKECVAACSVLEADVADNKAKVEAHYQCMKRTQDCSKVLECQ